MKDTFNLQRFCKYFKYDLNAACSWYGISMLAVGLMPVVLFVFSIVFSTIFTGQVSPIQAWSKASIFAVVSLVLLISAPSRLYGHLTDRRSGSDWLLVPASSLEKFISMMIVLCIVLPVVFLILFFGSDLLLSAFFPVLYGESITSSIVSGVQQVSSYVTENDMAVTNAMYLLIWASWVTYVLVFALGAICFKKNKIAKTFLAIIAFSAICSILIGFIVMACNNWNINIDEDMVEAFLDSLTPEKLQFRINLIMNLFTGIPIVALMAFIFLRIRTLKH